MVRRGSLVCQLMKLAGTRATSSFATAAPHGVWMPCSLQAFCSPNPLPQTLQRKAGIFGGSIRHTLVRTCRSRAASVVNGESQLLQRHACLSATVIRHMFIRMCPARLASLLIGRPKDTQRCRLAEGSAALPDVRAGAVIALSFPPWKRDTLSPSKVVTFTWVGVGASGVAGWLI